MADIQAFELQTHYINTFIVEIELNNKSIRLLINWKHTRRRSQIPFERKQGYKI